MNVISRTLLPGFPLTLKTSMPLNERKGSLQNPGEPMEPCVKEGVNERLSVRIHVWSTAYIQGKHLLLKLSWSQAAQRHTCVLSQRDIAVRLVNVNAAGSGADILGAGIFVWVPVFLSQ
jgi:hypothetical protein